MKKVVLFILFVAVSFFANAQKIQTHFFGNSFGSSMQDMMLSVDDCKKVEYNKLTAMDVRFGGYTWDFVNFKYVRNKLYHVNLSKYYENKHSALTFFSNIKQQLKAKYGSLYISEMDYNVLGVKGIFIADNYSRVAINVDHSKSKGGKMYYYVDLDYFDADLWEIASEEDNNEL